MKKLSISLTLLILISGCKGVLDTGSVTNLVGKKCSAVYIEKADIAIKLNLIDNDFNSIKLFIEGEELLYECKDEYGLCNRPFFRLSKVPDTNQVKVLIHDAKFQDLNDVDLKILTAKDGNQVGVIESENESLLWVEKEERNCQMTRSSELNLSE